VIFVTVGTELPFDRLTLAVDELCERHELRDVFMQIGEKGRLPRHAAFARFLPFAEMQARMREAQLVIAHAGPGSVSLARAHGKKPLILPRRPELREVIDRHQIVLAKRLEEMGAVHVISSEDELSDVVPRLLASGGGLAKDDNSLNHVSVAAANLAAVCKRVVDNRRPRGA
jgi:UDP-N-acetylglucosamine transferase subunit ALG13